MARAPNLLKCSQISLIAGQAACDLHRSQAKDESVAKHGRTTFAFTSEFVAKLRDLLISHILHLTSYIQRLTWPRRPQLDIRLLDLCPRKLILLLQWERLPPRRSLTL